MFRATNWNFNTTGPVGSIAVFTLREFRRYDPHSWFNWWIHSILRNICQALAPLLSQLSSYNGDSNPHYKKNFLRIVKIFTNNIQVTTTSFILYLKPLSQSAKSSCKWWDTWLSKPLLLRENNRSSWYVAGRRCIYLYKFMIHKKAFFRHTVPP